MALYSVATGATIQALDVTQFYNLLTGVMTDQPVTLGNILSVSPGTYRGAFGVGTSAPNYYGFTNASVATIYGGTSGGILELVSIAADGSGAVIGTMVFEAIMNAGHEVRLAEIQALSNGTTANNRGADLVLFTKVDGGALTEHWRLNKDGHVISSAVAIGVASNQQGGTVVTGVAISGNDQRGTYNFTTGSTPPTNATTLSVVTWGVAWAVGPVIVSSKNANSSVSGGVDIAITSAAANYTIVCCGTPGNALTYWFNWQVVG